MVVYVAHKSHPWRARFPVDAQKAFGKVHFLSVQPDKKRVGKGCRFYGVERLEDLRIDWKIGSGRWERRKRRGWAFDYAPSNTSTVSLLKYLGKTQAQIMRDERETHAF